MNIQMTSSTLDRVPASLKSWLGKPRPMLIDGKWVAGQIRKILRRLRSRHRNAAGVGGRRRRRRYRRRGAKRPARAFEGPWSRMSPSARGRIIHKIGDLILEHLDELAQLESLDNGKPFSVARVADVPLSADMFHYMSGWATKIEGKHIAISHLAAPGEYLSYTRPEPIGVVGQIIPVEFPAADGGLETGAGAGHRLHRGAEGGGGDAAVGAAAGRAAAGSGPARWRGQYRAGLRRNRGRGTGVPSRT